MCRSAMRGNGNSAVCNGGTSTIARLATVTGRSLFRLPASLDSPPVP